MIFNQCENVRMRVHVTAVDIRSSSCCSKFSKMSDAHAISFNFFGWLSSSDMAILSARTGLLQLTSNFCTIGQRRPSPSPPAVQL